MINKIIKACNDEYTIEYTIFTYVKAININKIPTPTL